ncbi:hypothetical protein L211DRAFT_722066 [Terfezia boudieri ATCC MYA-4762]|uniref:Uncharacterized protein n=1 Tax=Terfezia boudieri ATCC MYA-4762 TaxID=1051890 RepID=A0A3N4LAR3_9PEZI|nr:hypothetical protein L211DRAFT_722066 [Terfezia boudieri ATCC MYA-4762]
MWSSIRWMVALVDLRGVTLSITASINLGKSSLIACLLRRLFWRISPRAVRSTTNLKVAHLLGSVIPHYHSSTFFFFHLYRPFDIHCKPPPTVFFFFHFPFPLPPPGLCIIPVFDDVK